MGARITLGNLTIDRSMYMVWINDRPVDLTHYEFELLDALARSSQRVLRRESLVQTVWGEEQEGHVRKLAVHISRLRKKLVNSHPYSIRTIPKRGYALANVGHMTSGPPVQARARRRGARRQLASGLP